MIATARACLALLVAATHALAQARDLGSVGPTYPIAERDAATVIMERLQAKQQSGELQRLEDEAKRRSLDHVQHMPAVDGITTATTRTRRLIDPTVLYVKAVTTDDGRVVVPAGTHLNPLDVTALTKTLVFFDGRDATQVEAVARLVALGATRIKPILVAGEWLTLSRAWKTQVYFDQRGSLSRRFGVRAVPTVIRQQDKMLVLEEIPPKELR